MSDPKKPDDDIISSAPEEISDDKLEEVDGGYLTIKMTNFNSFPTGSVKDTIYAGGESDSIVGLDSNTVFDASKTTSFKFKR